MVFGVGFLFAQEITVSGTAVITKKPEIISFNLSVTGGGKSGDKAQGAMITWIIAVQKELTRLGVKFDTISYGINEDKTTQRGADGDFVIVINGFISTTNYRVVVNDMSKLPEVLEIASLPGVSQISNMEFDLSDRKEAAREAREKAVKDALANASAIAKAAGKHLGKIVKIQQNNVEFTDFFKGIVLPMDSIRVGGKPGWSEGEEHIIGQSAALAGTVAFNNAIIIPGEIIITTSVVMMAKIN